MGKYYKVFENNFQHQLVYRFNAFTYTFSQLLTFGVFFYIWSSIYRQSGQMGGYGLAQLVFYYLGATFINILVKGVDVAQIVGDQIRLGQLNSILLTPISYFWRTLASLLGGAFFRSLVALLVFGLGWLFLALKFGFYFDPSHFLYFLALICFSYLLNFHIFYLVGLATFWFGFIWAFNFTFLSLASFLGGGVLPLDLLPAWFVQVNNWLPFKYIVFVPVAVFTGRLEPSWGMFLTPALWVAALFILSRILFKRGLKKYEAFGG